jgi:hypothetical protein
MSGMVNTEDVVTARWPVIQGVALVALFLLVSGGYAVAIILDQHPPSRRELVIMTIVCSGSILGSLEFAQRAYRFEPGTISIRHLGVWSVYELPSRIEIFVDLDGSFAIYDASDGPFSLYVPKDVARPIGLGQRVTRFYGEHDRLGQDLG